MTEKRDERYEIVMQIRASGFESEESANKGATLFMNKTLHDYGYLASIVERVVYNRASGDDIREF